MEPKAPNDNESAPPTYAPPPYPGPGGVSAQPQYPPPGQGYGWQQSPPAAYPGPPQPYAGAPPVTHPPHLGGDSTDKGGYPTNPPSYQGQPGYPAPPGQPGYPVQPGYYPGYQQGYHVPPITAQQTNSVTVMQGGVGPSIIVAPQIAPPDYCFLAWFACLFCFCPTGICAILKSNETRDAILRGDFVTANMLSMETRKFANLSIGIGVAFFVVGLIVRFVAFAAST